jgi:hypothetical protein
MTLGDRFRGKKVFTHDVEFLWKIKKPARLVLKRVLENLFSFRALAVFL